MSLLTETLEPAGTLIMLVTNKTADREIEQDENIESTSSKELEDKFWPPAAVAVNVQSLLHANSRYLQDIPPASASS